MYFSKLVKRSSFLEVSTLILILTTALLFVERDLERDDEEREERERHVLLLHPPKTVSTILQGLLVSITLLPTINSILKIVTSTSARTTSLRQSQLYRGLKGCFYMLNHSHFVMFTEHR